jgi:hypothetical protein
MVEILPILVCLFSGGALLYLIIDISGRSKKRRNYYGSSGRKVD